LTYYAGITIFVKNSTDNMKLLDRITVNPDVCNGKPTIRGMRITVKTILEFVAAGESNENIIKAFPYLEPDDVKAALEFAAKTSDASINSYRIAS
jgi:uncharacterized protein (DUF433 family)